MDSSRAIIQFLDQVRRRRTGIYLGQRFLQILAGVLAGALFANLFAYFSDNPRPFLTPFVVVLAVLLTAGLVTLLVKALFFKPPIPQTALWVEGQVKDLNNSLISAVQLEPCLEQSSSPGLSRDMIRELIRRTHQRVQKLEISQLVPAAPLFHGGRWTAGVFLFALAASLLLPDFLTRGYDHWVQPPALAQALEKNEIEGRSADAPIKAIQYAVEDLSLTFNYPAYTRKKPVTRHPSDGKIKTLPGTEIVLRGTVNAPVEGASLLLNGKDDLSMTVHNKTSLEGRFFTREPGFYQFRMKTPEGNKVLLPYKYAITLERDHAPRIHLTVGNPKPVYYLADKVQLYYEGSDDFGISKIDLVVDIEGRTQRKTIKRIKSIRKEIKDSYRWELSTMDFRPGDRVNYYFEIQDNDNVSGPNTGQSEVFSFDVFDQQKKRLDLLALQEQLIDQMVALLADSLVTDITQMKSSREGLEQLKRVLARSTNQLIDIIVLAQSIEAQAKEIDSFPKPYLTLINTMVSGFNEIRQDQIDAMNRITNAMIKATPIGLDYPPLEEVQGRLITQLERNIIFMVKILNRERMEQAMDLEQTLTDLTESLREEFQKAKNQKGKTNIPQFKKALRKIKQTLQKIMEQLAKQNQGLNDEFLNPSAFENLNMENFAASLEKLMNLVNQGKIDEAMEELEKLADDLRAFSNQMEDMNGDQENLMDMKIMQQLEEALEKIGKLEEGEKELLDKTTQINKNLRSRQTEKFENLLEEFFADLRKDVKAILSILHKDERLLGTHPDMKKLIDLIEEESRISERIRNLNQQTLDSLKDSRHRKNFVKLNKARKELSENIEKQKALQMKMFYGFKNFLPELLEKYNRLEELTELMDLYEFSALFKNTYPDVLRWQNHFRTSRKMNPDLLDQMKLDLMTITQINNEISKKLGTLMRDLKQDYENLISDQNRQNMQQMAGQQKELRQQTEDLSQMLRQMNQDNPMISPRLGQKITGSGKHMKAAENNLQGSRVQESIDSENKALQQLTETRELLDQLKEAGQRPSKSRSQRMMRLGQGQAPDNKRGGGTNRMQQEKVNLPTEDQYKVPGQFREDILKAMKNKYPKKYERLVGEYYKELVK